MSDEKPKELEVRMSSQVQEAIENDPELAKAMEHFLTCMREASEGVQTGKYANMEDAMEAITGELPQSLDPDDLTDNQIEMIEEMDREIEIEKVLKGNEAKN